MTRLEKTTTLEKPGLVHQHRSGKASSVITITLVALLGLSLVTIGLIWSNISRVEPAKTTNPNKGVFLPEEGFTGSTSFELINQSDKKVTDEDLLGKVWVAGFIFTRCPGVCPIVTGEMKMLRKKLPDDIPLVTFTVDPEYDTPEVLTEYIKSNKIRDDHWMFLTGDKKEIRRLVTEGYKLAVADRPDAKEGEEWIIHSPRLMLVTKNGRVHGMYDSRIPIALTGLKMKATKLMREKLTDKVKKVIEVRDRFRPKVDDKTSKTSKSATSTKKKTSVKK